MDDSTVVVDALSVAAPRLRTAVAQARTGLTVAERSEMMAAWAAVDTASKVAILWRDHNGAAVDPKLVTAVDRLSADTRAVLDNPSDGTIQTHAVAVYNDAQAVGQMFAVASPRQAGATLPAMTADACKTRSDAVIADLGGLATGELLLGTTRVGYPWVALSPNEIAARLDPSALVRPAWVHGSPADTDEAAAARAAVTSRFHGDVAKAHDALAAFDRARQGGFGPRAALELSRSSSSSPQQLAALDSAIRRQATAAAAAPTGAPADFVLVGALVDGLHSGARARAAALAAGKPPGVAHDLAPTASDQSLVPARRDLESCALLPDAGVVRPRVMTALTMIAAFGTPGATCTAGQNDCEPGTTCSGGVCAPWCGGCTAGDTCVEGRCEFPQHACQTTTDCVFYPNTTCSDGECVQTCGTTLCGRDQICLLTCVPRSTCGICKVGQYCDGDAPSACENGPAERQCTNDVNCTPPSSVPSQANPRCISVANDNGTPINMCIGIGWACHNADDCGPGTECDQSIGQCVDRETYACNITNACRSAEGCVAGDGGAQRCEVKIPAIGQPCDATAVVDQLVYGECRKGTWQDAGHGAQKCVPGAPKPEICDGLDNDCNGVVDDGVPSHGCTAQAPGACAHGNSSCVAGNEQCTPGQRSQEICDGQDNDCNGVVDDIQPVPCTAAAIGDCAHGTTSCSSGGQVCNPSLPNGEVCDGRDNDCNGVIDDLKTSREATIVDGQRSDGPNLFGVSDNFLFGVPDCGGERELPFAVKQSGGDSSSHCEVVDWADIVCQNPGRSIGQSDFKDACASFAKGGGKLGNNPHECRYIVHFGANPFIGLTCQMSHKVKVPETCH